MKDLLNLNGVKTLNRAAQKTIHGGDYVMDDCGDFCPGQVVGDIFTGECTCITGS